MPHDFCCPGCGEPLRRPSRSRRLRCPRCRHGFQAPAAEAADPDPRQFRRSLLGADAPRWAAILLVLSVLWMGAWLVFAHR